MFSKEKQAVKDNSCTAYYVSNNGLCASRIASFYGEDINNPDAAMCAAIVNIDSSHFKFCYPELEKQ